MKPYKKPKYKFDVDKLTAESKDRIEKEKDWTAEELYKESLREKSRYRRK